MSVNPRTILLADDDPEDQELLKDAILDVEPETEVLAVSNGKQVLEYLDTCPDIALPCIIILDYSMPALNGAQVLTQLSLKPRYQYIPVVIWSTSNAKAYMKECLEKGASGYFVKPSSPHKLYEQVKEILGLCA